MADIFISYKREDQEHARRLAEALEEHGWKVWWDPKLRAGERFDDAIDAALKAAKCVIVIWSRRSVESSYVKDEATYALNRHKLVPLEIEDVELPFRFEGIHTPQLFDWDGSASDVVFQKIVHDIELILGPAPGKAEAKQAEEEARDETEVEQRQRTEQEVQRKADQARKLEEEVAQRKAAESPASQIAEPGHPTVPPAGPRSPLTKIGVLGGIVVAATVFAVIMLSERESDFTPTTDGPATDSAMLPEMVEISAGCFQMGSPLGEGGDAQKPQHRVCVDAFTMGKYEVTFDEYDRFAEATGREKPSDQGWGRGRHPVVNVSWEDATAYVEWLSRNTEKRLRLPTESEWEYAARAGTGTRWSFGDGEDDLDKYAWYGRNSGLKMHPAGGKRPNPWGLQDTHGNVWEWVADCWHDSYQGAPVDGSAWGEGDGGDCGGRVFRGGSWADVPTALRSAARFRGGTDFRADYLGFRLAQDL